MAEGYAYVTEPSIGTPCLICDETVPILHLRETPKICDKCKAAVMAMRAKMDGERKGDE